MITDKSLLDAIEVSIGDIKRLAQSKGYMVRMTEWHEGFQCAIYRKTDVRDCFVSDWNKIERQSWEQVLRWLPKESADDCG